MTFSFAKTTTLKPQKSMALSTFLIALAVASLFFIPSIIMDRGYFIFYGDFNVQQIPFYMEAHNAFRSGNFGWNWLTDLGANFISSYSYYLVASPFFWLTLPFPNSFVPYLMGPLLILKFACCALTAYFYIRRFTKTPDAARIGGLLYAFSGFSIYNIFFNAFHEAIIVFPLLLLAFELLLTENKRGVFALMVCVCAATNYFFFFGMAVFTVIYFVVRVSSGAVKVTFKRFGVIALEAVLGLVMGAVLLIPSLLTVLGNNRVDNILLGWNAIMYGKEQIYLNVIECFFFPPDIPSRPVFFPGADVKWSSLGGWLPLFSMVGVFVFFMQRKGHWLKRVIGICTFMALVPFLNSAFYAFNSAYYARWFYMPILMMSLATMMLTEDREVDWSGGFKWVLGITVAFAAVIGFFPQENSEGEITFGLYSPDVNNTYAVRFWIACLIAIVSLLILYFTLSMIKQNRKGFFKAALVCVCIISVIYGNVYIMQGREHSFDQESIMIDQLIEGELELDDADNYRIDCYDCVDNTSMFLGYPGINAFHSVVPNSIMEFYPYVGVTRDVASRPETDLYALRGLLSVKYVLNRVGADSFVDEEGNTKMQGYSYVKTENGHYVYQNDNFVPYGFSYDYYMTEAFCESHDEEDRSKLMMKALLLSEEQIKKYSHILDNVEKLYGTPAGATDRASLSLGYENYVYDCKARAQTSAYEFTIDKKGFTAKVRRNSENLVFFSVPYEEGWTATVNGEKADIERVNNGFMAVLVPSGDSTIRFDYETPGLKVGALVSLFAVAVFIVYMLLSKIYLRKHPSVAEYPEGDELLEQWKQDDAAEELDEQVYEELKHKSILDEDDDFTQIPHIESGFDGGFKIDTSFLKDEDEQ